MHRQRGNEEVLALAMQAVRYPRRGEVRYFVSLGEELFVDEPISEDTSMRIDIPPDLSHLPSHRRNALFRLANVSCHHPAPPRPSQTHARRFAARLQLVT